RAPKRRALPPRERPAQQGGERTPRLGGMGGQAEAPERGGARGEEVERTRACLPPCPTRRRAPRIRDSDLDAVSAHGPGATSMIIVRPPPPFSSTLLLVV